MAEKIERYQAKINFAHNFVGIRKKLSRSIFEISSPTFYARNIPFHLSLRKKDAKGIYCDLVCDAKLEKGASFNIEYQLTFTLITNSQKVLSPEFSNLFKDQHCFQRTLLSGKGNGISKCNAITVELSLWVHEPQGIPGYMPPKETLRQQLQFAENKVHKSNAFLLDSGDFSDVTFVVSEDSSRIKAHKYILALRSEVFARMLSTEMAEARDNEIRMEDMGAPALKIMLHHIYTGQLGFPKGVKIDLKICQELANAGEKYNLQNLKEYWAMGMTEFVSVENAWALLTFAKRLKAEAATNALTSYCGANVYKIMEKL